MPQTPLRTLSIYDRGSAYTIYDTDDKTHLFTVRFNSHSAPHMTVNRASDNKSVVGSATYHRSKKFGLSITSNTTLAFPSSSSSSDAVTLNREGGFFSNNKRAMWSAVLGHVYWSSRQVNNPWKGGQLETSFMRLADASGRTLVKYGDEGHTLDRMGVLDIGVELRPEALDEIVVSGMAMMSEEQTGVKVRRI